MREEFYKSKEAIIKWAQDGNRKSRNNDDQGSHSSDTTFASLKADSETYISVDSFAANRYSHWDYLKPPAHLVADSQSEIGSQSEHSASSLSEESEAESVGPTVDKLSQLLDQGTVFELPRMTSTPTPYSPILKEVQVTPIVEEEELTVLDEDADETRKSTLDGSSQKIEFCFFCPR